MGADKDKTCAAVRAVEHDGVMSATWAHHCVSCEDKCRWLAENYPLAFRARPLEGDGTDDC